MYQLFIKIMYEQDFRKYTIQEISEMRAILEEFKGRTLEVNLKRIKEVENVSAMGEEKVDGGSRLSL
jgi:chemotaxis regulatin CheY-phosphate phosphatase CheZ